jgi:prevent-host-death family protein
MCYARRMADIASRELRNNTRAVLARVEAGESITITVDGRPVAVLEPIRRRRSFMTREEFIREVLPYQADPELLDELRKMNPDTTDELPWR